MINCYATGHEISNVMMNSFSRGCDGKVVNAHSLLPGAAAVYGILRGTEDIIKHCEEIKRDYYYIDHGYFNSGHFSGYYRVTKNGRQKVIYEAHDRNYPDDRWRSLGKDIQPWKRIGRNIVIFPFNEVKPFGFPVAKFYNIDPRKWVDNIKEECKLHSDRTVVVKEKWKGNIEDVLDDAWVTISHSSNASMEGLLAGVPTIVTGESACLPISWRFEDIEKPWWPSREWLMNSLAYQQFTLEEMYDGTAWRALNDS